MMNSHSTPSICRMSLYGAHPVTVAPFEAFVQASGHQPQDEDCLQGLPNHPAGRANSANKDVLAEFDPSACHCGGTPSDDAVQTRSGRTAAISLVSRLSQFLFAPYQLTPTLAAARAHPRQWLDQALAPQMPAMAAGLTDHVLDPARGAALSRAVVAPSTCTPLVARTARWMKRAGTLPVLAILCSGPNTICTKARSQILPERYD